MSVGEFDIAALYDALDAERRARGLTWQDAARALRVSASTLTGMRTRRVVEGDGVLQILLWLDRTAESFVSGAATAPKLESDPPPRILRFDVRAIYDALDAQRLARGLTWPKVAAEIGGLNAGRLTRLAEGGRVAFPEVMRILRWLDRSVASATRVADR